MIHDKILTMKKTTILCILAVFAIQVSAQKLDRTLIPPPSKDLNAEYAVQKEANRYKVGGEEFWTEEFDWKNESTPLGWLLPEGWTIEDPTDLGYNWHWNIDTLKGVYTNEPLLNSTTRNNGCLALNLDGYNKDFANYTDYLAVNSSIMSPPIDCSGRSSVLVRFEQNFRYWSSAIMLFEVTIDDGVHWAVFDMSMGALINERSGGIPTGGKVDLILNITDVAAGADQVQFKITWRDSRLYYWMIDDITFMEGFNNDLQMLYSEVDYDNGTDDPEGFFWSVPKTQISGYNIHSIVRNFGNLEQWGTHMNVQVTKNNQVIFNQNTPEFLSYPLQVDTLRMPGQFIPEDFGHYRIDLTIEAEEDDEIPHDNGASVPFQVSDSLFSRCDNTPETSFSTWAWYEQPHEGDVMGVWYTLKSDMEISSVSAYISYADIRSSFRFVLMGYNLEDQNVYPLMVSEMVDMDSTILKQHWVTLPLEKDGESEFLKAGHSYLVGVEFWNNLDFEEAKASNRYGIGSDRSNFFPPGTCWYYFAGDDAWYSTGTHLMMVRMNLDDHSNIIDGLVSDPHQSFELYQNYPNPFSRQTTLSWNLPVSSPVILSVYTLDGRLVIQKDFGRQDAGMHHHVLSGEQLSTGQYFYTLQGDSFRRTARMTVQ